MTLLRQKLVGEQPTMTWLVGNTHCKKMGTFYSWPDQLSSSTSNKWTNSLEQTNFRVCKTFFLVHLWKFKIYFWRYQIERACILLKQRLIEKCLKQCSFKSFYQILCSLPMLKAWPPVGDSKSRHEEHHYKYNHI